MGTSRLLALVAAGALGLGASAPVFGGPLRDWVQTQRAERAERADVDGLEENAGSARLQVPAGIKVWSDQAYGTDRRQRLDVYAQPGLSGAPVVFMVHGGAWRTGDKTMPRVVQNKLDHWGPRGIVFVSVNYRLLPEADVLSQAADVAAALAFAQREAPRWGGDPRRFVLMGHSAGGQLIALLAAAPAPGLAPPLGSVILDSAVFDVPSLMHERHLPLYDRAFGQEPAFWRRTSPQAQLQAGVRPLLLVCSSRRRDACPQADGFAQSAQALGGRASVLPLPLKHSEINEQLGQEGAYTRAVDAFLARLDPELARRLQP
ncbi:alpha/beta hydrolase [uncultured Pseudomonas sp.]|uniref:alpha/beta hydrolase n=1 Tax=uncultured Pseudomonas sp. TaxID=114707 RepID=UPI0025F2897A|nr:alpha/beta hydrolase [uncultured Pseudomonas sp.]